MDNPDLPGEITCLYRGADGSMHLHTLYLRPHEREYAWVYATPRGEAIDGVDLISVCIPKDTAWSTGGTSAREAGFRPAFCLRGASIGARGLT